MRIKSSKSCNSSKVTRRKKPIKCGYDPAVVWDIADSFSGYSHPITDSWDGDMLLEMQKIADACDCSLEEAAQIMIDELGFDPADVDLNRLKGVKSSTVTGAYDFLDDYDDDYDSAWEMIDHKMVTDSDGFQTDYTMYHNLDTDEWVCVFGDNELYKPEDGVFDWECDSEADCREWFDDYTGFEDDFIGFEDDEDIY